MFVRNMDFVPSQDRQSRDHTFTDGTRLRVVLTKSPSPSLVLPPAPG